MVVAIARARSRDDASSDDTSQGAKTRDLELEIATIQDRISQIQASFVARIITRVMRWKCSPGSAFFSRVLKSRTQDS